MTHFVVETAGPRTLIEDAGRRGWADLGISGCGAWDRRAYLDGARLVGNGAGLGCLEILLGPVRLRCVGGPVLVAVTGRMPRSIWMERRALAAGDFSLQMVRR